MNSPHESVHGVYMALYKSTYTSTSISTHTFHTHALASLAAIPPERWGLLNPSETAGVVTVVKGGVF